jgi:hypothetical protein
MKKHLQLLFLFLIPVISFSQKFGYHDYYPVDTIFFEYNTLTYQIQPSTDNCWQVGHPSKTYFNSSYSEPLAIVTDTLNPYPVNSNSSFSFVIPYDLVQFSFTTYFQFYQKYDTDTIQDYGTVEASYDGGVSWNILKDSTCTNWDCIQLAWDSDMILATGAQVPHLLNSSGHSNGWIMSRYYWWWMMPVDGSAPQPPDSIIVRFSFHSDATHSAKEGWMIDNILIGLRDEGSGIGQINDENALKIIPQPLVDKSRVICTKPGKFYDFTLYDLYGNIIFSQKLQANRTITLNRSDFNSGLYLWKSSSNGVVNQTGKLVVY